LFTAEAAALSCVFFCKTCYFVTFTWFQQNKKNVAEIAVHIYPDEAESNWYKLSKIEIET